MVDICNLISQRQLCYYADAVATFRTTFMCVLLPLSQNTLSLVYCILSNRSLLIDSDM